MTSVVSPASPMRRLRVQLRHFVREKSRDVGLVCSPSTQRVSCTNGRAGAGGSPPSGAVTTAASVVCAGSAALFAVANSSAFSVARAVLTAITVSAAPSTPGFQVIPVPGDGNCLFRAVAQGEAVATSGKILLGAAETARSEKLRAAAIQELVWRRDEIEWAIEGDFDRYVSRMALSGTWGGEPELLMLSHVLGCPIEVYMMNPKMRKIQVYGEGLSPTAVRLLFHGAGHYEALRRAGTPEDANGKDLASYIAHRNRAATAALDL